MSADYSSIFESITGSFPDRPPLVLIVDDEATIRLMTRRFLEHAGFMVIDAASADAAKKQISVTQPDIILLDVDMPGTNGFELTRWIRQQEALSYTPVVMITGREDPESVSSAYEVGATDFIVKPISWSVIAYRVRYILRNSQTQLALRESHARVKAIVEALPDRLYLLNSDARVIGDNTSLAEYRSTNPGSQSIPAAAWNSQENVLRSKVESECRAQMNTSPEEQNVESSISVLDERGRQQHFEVRLVKQSTSDVLAVVRDVTDQREATHRIHQLAYYDTLTGLPNRQFFSNELKLSMERARATQSRFALLYIDLDHFKRINDTLGHTTGDELLKMVALRLERCLRSEDMLSRQADGALAESRNVARLGGDEFTLIVRNERAVDNIESVAGRIIDTLKTPFEFTGHEFVVTPSVGIAIYPEDGADEESLLKAADVAMYQAKQAGRSGYSFCTETTSVRSLERLDLEIDLRRALEQGQFELHYQPKVRVGDWRITGAEALLRWQHPERGWISPGKIIPIAEDTGLIVPIGRWIIEEACRQLAEWSRHGLKGVPVSVNLSSQQFWQDDVASVVEAALGTHELEADWLELELTEGVLMQDVQQTRDALQALKKIGVTLAVDDFGTGYSSLAYLRQFPLDALKIDRSFVCDLPDEDAAAICDAIISMATSLKLKTVAEGVETYSQLDYLTRRSCDEIQGYYFSKPIPARDLLELLIDGQKFSSVVENDHAAMVAANASAI